MKLVDKALVPGRLLDSVQVRTLEIFDEGERQHRSIVKVPDHSRNLRPAEPRCGAKAALACDKLPSVAEPSNGYRLEQSAGANRRL
jgi:hypothetical protein